MEIPDKSATVGVIRRDIRTGKAVEDRDFIKNRANQPSHNVMPANGTHGKTSADVRDAGSITDQPSGVGSFDGDGSRHPAILDQGALRSSSHPSCRVIGSDLDIFKEEVPDRRARSKVGEQSLVHPRRATGIVDVKVADLVIVTVQVTGKRSSVPYRHPALSGVEGIHIQVDVGAQLEIGIREIADLV